MAAFGAADANFIAFRRMPAVGGRADRHSYALDLREETERWRCVSPNEPFTKGFSAYLPLWMRQPHQCVG